MSNRTRATWRSMHRRCGDPKDAGFASYGGRGIHVCERWASFEQFLADMGERPAGLTLDRINNDGNYEPGNCRWATPKQQGRNRANNHRLTWNGETLTMAEWCERTGLIKSTIRTRLNNGWPVERALGAPKDPYPRVTHCKRGHEYSEGNTYWHKSKGRWRRHCRACNLVLYHALRARRAHVGEAAP